MLKKIVSLVVGATLVLATLGVSAATIATESVYNTAGDIEVTTTVTGVAKDEVYTYLAYKQAEVADLEDLIGAEVAYVDEKTVTDEDVANGEIVFTYVTREDFKGATIAFGGAGAGTKQKIEVAEPSRSYTVQLNDDGAIVDGTINTDGVGDTDLVDIDIVDIGNVQVTGVSINGEPVNDWFVTTTGIKLPLGLITDGAEIKVAATTSPNGIVGVLNAAFIPKDEDVTGEKGKYDSIIVVARIEGVASEYGIVLSKDADFSDYAEFKALGKGSNGMYAVKVNGFDKHDKLKDATTIYAKAYATGFNGYPAPSVREIEIPSAAEEDAPVVEETESEVTESVEG